MRQFAGLALFASLSLFAQGPDFTPPNPLYAAAMRNDTAEALRLLAAGANPNDGTVVGLSTLVQPIMNRNLPMMRALLANGANVNAPNPAGFTPLMWAAASEVTSPEFVEELIQHGANVNAVNQAGETALTWARRRGHTPIVTALLKAGAQEPPRAKEAVEKALALLQKSGDQFARVSGCTSCHHQSLPQMVAGMARQRGYAVNEKISKQQADAVIAVFKPARELMLQGTDRIPDVTISAGYSLLGLHAEGYRGDEVTEAMAHVISTKQRADGSFPSMPGRPPIESSDITATALSLRAMQVYGKNSEAAVQRARAWLLQQEPRTNEERAMQLLGLTWAQAEPAELTKRAQALLAEQRADGGWAQLATLETDAYATGQALYALFVAGQVSAADLAYRRGSEYLLRTQLADGSWHVRSRSFPLQPLKESGFPHGKDQWISATGTSWAALALAVAPPAALPQASDAGVE